MRALVHQGVDHPSQCQQTLIDEACLSSTLIICSASLNVLTSCKVDQIQFAGTDVLLASLSGSLHICCDGKDGVASGAQVVALGSSNLASMASRLQQLNSGRRRIDVGFLHALHEGAAIAVTFLGLVFIYFQFRILFW